MTTTTDTTTESTTHWTEEVNVHDLHEPTVRCIIDTMRRTGAKFAARVLEAQYASDQIAHEPSKEGVRLRELAEFFDQHPDFPMSLDGKYYYSRIYVGASDAEELIRLRRIIGGSWAKQVSGANFFLDGQIGYMLAAPIPGMGTA